MVCIWNYFPTGQNIIFSTWWTTMSAVPQKAVKLNHALTHSTQWKFLYCPQVFACFDCFLGKLSHIKLFELIIESSSYVVNVIRHMWDVWQLSEPGDNRNCPTFIWNMQWGNSTKYCIHLGRYDNWLGYQGWFTILWNLGPSVKTKYKISCYNVIAKLQEFRSLNSDSLFWGFNRIICNYKSNQIWCN